MAFMPERNELILRRDDESFCLRMGRSDFLFEPAKMLTTPTINLSTVDIPRGFTKWPYAFHSDLFAFQDKRRSRSLIGSKSHRIIAAFHLGRISIFDLLLEVASPMMIEIFNESSYFHSCFQNRSTSCLFRC
jgi:hypothetical protein